MPRADVHLLRGPHRLGLQPCGVQDRCAEKMGVLCDVPYSSSIAVDIKAIEVNPVDEYLALVGSEETEQQTGHRGLACSRASHMCDPLPRGNMQVDVMQDLFRPSRISERYPFELNIPIRRDQSL